MMIGTHTIKATSLTDMMQVDALQYCVNMHINMLRAIKLVVVSVKSRIREGLETMHKAEGT